MTVCASRLLIHLISEKKMVYGCADVVEESYFGEGKTKAGVDESR